MSTLSPVQAAAHYVTQPEIWPEFVRWLRRNRPESTRDEAGLWSDVAEAHAALTAISDAVDRGETVLIPGTVEG